MDDQAEAGAFTAAMAMSEVSEPSQKCFVKLMVHFPVGHPKRAGGGCPVASEIEVGVSRFRAARARGLFKISASRRRAFLQIMWRLLKRTLYFGAVRSGEERRFQPRRRPVDNFTMTQSDRSPSPK